MAQAGIVVNLIFMFLNLLPILPLDGGRIVASLLPHARGVRSTPGSSRWGMPHPARAAASRNVLELRARAAASMRI